MNKVCQCCGKVHFMVPINARPQLDFNETFTIGFMWECSCGSTMFLKTRDERLPDTKEAS